MSQEEETSLHWRQANLLMSNLLYDSAITKFKFEISLHQWGENLTTALQQSTEEQTVGSRAMESLMHRPAVLNVTSMVHGEHYAGDNTSSTAHETSAILPHHACRRLPRTGAIAQWDQNSLTIFVYTCMTTSSHIAVQCTWAKEHSWSIVTSARFTKLRSLPAISRRLSTCWLLKIHTVRLQEKPSLSLPFINSLSEMLESADRRKIMPVATCGVVIAINSCTTDNCYLITETIICF